MLNRVTWATMQFVQRVRSNAEEIFDSEKHECLAQNEVERWIL